jgi:RNA polymerase sigma-54 factor
MRQSLDVLQMSSEDLALWLQEQIESNPMMEWKEPVRPISRKTSQTFDLQEPIIAYEPSLFESLINQARGVIQDPLALEKMEWIIGHLESTGLFLHSLEEAPSEWDRKELSLLLSQLQEIAPPGIGARSIQESLCLQLKAKSKEDSVAYLLIKEDFEELLEGNLFALQKKYRVEEKALRKMIREEISCLDPYPGLRFQKSSIPPLIPDLILMEETDHWHVEIYEGRLPTFTIQALPVHFDTMSAEDKTFLRRYSHQAFQIQYAINKRHKTLRAVANQLVQIQKNYLKGEADHLLPLNRQEIAEKLGLHESTIARAVAGKYLFCQLGIIALSSLLSKSLNKAAENISTHQAQKLLQKLIAEEDKEKPFSDQELLEKMQKIGVPCARRTVTKYRQVLRIPSGRLRRKQGI